MTSQGYLDVTGMWYGTTHEHQRSACITFRILIIFSLFFVINFHGIRVWVADICQSAGAVNHLQTFPITGILFTNFILKSFIKKILVRKTYNEILQILNNYMYFVSLLFNLHWFYFMHICVLVSYEKLVFMKNTKIINKSLINHVINYIHIDKKIINCSIIKFIFYLLNLVYFSFSLSRLWFIQRFMQHILRLFIWIKEFVHFLTYLVRSTLQIDLPAFAGERAFEPQEEAAGTFLIAIRRLWRETLAQFIMVTGMTIFVYTLSHHVHLCKAQRSAV